MNCIHHDEAHECPCPLGTAMYSYIDKSDPDRIVSYTVRMVTYCNGAVSLAPE